MTINVSLDIRNGAASSGDGYTTVRASDNTQYSYQYTGGSDGSGGVTEHLGSAEPIVVSVIADPRYLISRVDIIDPDAVATPPIPQLGVTVAAGSRSATIVDLATATDSGSYCVRITDTSKSPNCTLDCDPPVTNVPP